MKKAPEYSVKQIRSCSSAYDHNANSKNWHSTPLQPHRDERYNSQLVRPRLTKGSNSTSRHLTQHRSTEILFGLPSQYISLPEKHQAYHYNYSVLIRYLVVLAAVVMILLSCKQSSKSLRKVSMPLRQMISIP